MNLAADGQMIGQDRLSGRKIKWIRLRARYGNALAKTFERASFKLRDTLCDLAHFITITVAVECNITTRSNRVSRAVGQ